MKVEKIVAVAMLVALGYPKAPEWDDEKLRDRLRQLPDRLEESKIPESYKSLFFELRDLKAGDKITLLDEQSAEAAKPKPAKKEKKPAPAKESKKKPAVPAKKEKKPVAAEPPAEEEDKPRAKASPRPTSIRAKISAVLTGEWQDEEQIVVATGVNLHAVRRYLAWLRKGGKAEKKRTVQFRLK